MTVRLENEAIILEGICGVEQVEVLLGLLEQHPGLPVDIGGAQTLHTALWQVLLMVRPTLVNLPTGGFVGGLLVPALGLNHVISNSS
jgi:hypothetical protein